jgi:hypothetical protein
MITKCVYLCLGKHHDSDVFLRFDDSTLSHARLNTTLNPPDARATSSIAITICVAATVKIARPAVPRTTVATSLP